jgi:ABC-type phosphate/phosphonate transport system substrate-binding protein/predicted acylesterase/phospholipase RssA
MLTHLFTSTRLPYRFRHLTAAAAILLLALCAIAKGQLLSPSGAPTIPTGAPPVELRIGVIGWESPDSQKAKFEQLFRRLSTSTGKSFHIRLAVGTYGEVLHWVDRGLVDLAVLTPAAYCQTKPLRDSADAPNCEYVATWRKYKPNAWGQPVPTAAHPTAWVDDYRLVCRVREKSGIKTIDDLVERASRKQARFLFVDPLSASGRIVPMLVLNKLGIPYQDQMAYTYSHDDSLAMLLKDAIRRRDEPPQVGDPELVLFIHEGVRPKAASQNDLALISEVNIPEFRLDEYQIPHEVWVSRPDYDFATFKSWLLNLQNELPDKSSNSGSASQDGHEFVDHSEWSEDRDASIGKLRKRFGNVISWFDELDVKSEFDRLMSLKQVLGLIKHDMRNGANVRLALVLTGGGAKCAYQAGAVEVIEQAISNDISLPGERRRLDIDLVVGTSGGAINAVPIALRVTKTQEGVKALQDLWRGLDLRKLIRPKFWIRVLLGIWLVYPIVALIAVMQWAVNWLRALRHRKKKLPGEPGYIREWVAASFFLVLPAIAIVAVFCLSLFAPTRYFSESRWVFYIWSLIYYGIRWSAVWLFILGAYSFLKSPSNLVIKRAGHWVPSLNACLYSFYKTSQWLYRRTVLVILCLMPTIVIFAICMTRGSLVEDRALTSTLTVGYSSLLPDSAFPKGKANANSETVSQAILAQPNRRDLVITASALRVRAGVNELDRVNEEITGATYFFAPHAKLKSLNDFPAYGERGVYLLPEPPGRARAADGSKLTDFVLGSGTLFPIFPSHRVMDFPNENDQTELIDGGFAHNNPIEAAVQWGATHIVVIAASPKSDQGHPSDRFGWNLVSAHEYLYDQAQYSDVAAQESVPVFTLRPQNDKWPNRSAKPVDGEFPSILDFAEHFTNYAIELGKANAASECFERQKGRPNFIQFYIAPTP